jgi:hypothetical protein
MTYVRIRRTEVLPMLTRRAHVVRRTDPAMGVSARVKRRLCGALDAHGIQELLRKATAAIGLDGSGLDNWGCQDLAGHPSFLWAYALDAYLSRER